MKKFRNIEIGSVVEFFHFSKHEKIEGSEHTYNGMPAWRSRKIYSTKPYANGVVVKIKGHNAHACRVFLDNGQEVEIGLDSHFHLGSSECVAH